METPDIMIEDKPQSQSINNDKIELRIDNPTKNMDNEWQQESQDHHCDVDENIENATTVTSVNDKILTTINNNNENNKFQFRAPQQFLHHKKSSWKKSWKKYGSKSRQKNRRHHHHHHHHHNNHHHNKNHQKQQQQQQQSAVIIGKTSNNAENGHQQLQQQQQQPITNNQHHHYHNNHRKLQQKNNSNNKQQQHNTLYNDNKKMNIFKRMTQQQQQALSSFSIRSKFFLPQKRPRKEIIIPPTKFLLGGNISDPLNLNSLQDEAINSSSSTATTPNITPKQSPITTPPKVEVIIPPNIHDPLHLLDPVDSTEYEKQLVSPMKRKSKSKHRHRKKRPKRKQQQCDETGIATTAVTVKTTANISGFDFSLNSNNSENEQSLNSSQQQLTKPIDHQTISIHSSTILVTSTTSSNETEERQSNCYIETNEGNNGFEINSDSEKKPLTENETNGNNNDNSKGNEKSTDNLQSISSSIHTRENEEYSKVNINDPLTIGKRSVEREKISKELRLDLALANAHQQQQQQNQLHSANSSCSTGGVNINSGGRKRKNSEGPNSAKHKFRRMDSLDKIVSPVVPQPGAWKRPPRTVPSGGRKNSRVRSTSTSENELISPTDEGKAIEENLNNDTHSSNENNKISSSSSLSLTSIVHDCDNQSKQENEQHEQLPHKKLKQEQQEQQQQQQNVQENQQFCCSINNSHVPKKFKPDGAKYQYGNYDNYAGYRNLTEFVDVRLQIFKRHYDLFKGKDILDIGCNVGHMTIAVGQKLSPKSILGIDIDTNLILKARKNLSLHVKIPKDVTEDNNNKDKNNSLTFIGIQNSGSGGGSKEIKNQIKKSKRKQHNKSLNFNSKLKFEISRNELFPISFPICYGSIPNLNSAQQQQHQQNDNDDSKNDMNTNNNNHKNETSPPSAMKKPKQFKNEFPKNVFFRATNYVLPDESLLNNDTQQYDLILCLSVTKWIHLNFGDAGLKLAFKRMFNQLRPGGKLILEAQNWASYKKRKNLTETIYNNYKNIEFFPDNFHEYLLSNEVGFSHAYTLDVPRHKSKGFSRPIQLYAKGDFTPSHIRWSDNYHPQITPYEAYRGIYAAVPRAPQHPHLWNYDTPVHGGGGNSSGNYSRRQTPMHQPTSQYYNPLETDSYLPSYDTEILNRHYVFASPLYQTVWSPPTSLRNSSSHTPLFGSIRDYDIDEGISSTTSRHVYLPNYYDDGNSPHQISSGGSSSGGAFNSIREIDSADDGNYANRRHVYATTTSATITTMNCENSSSSSPNVLADSNNDEALIPSSTSSVTSSSRCNTAASSNGNNNSNSNSYHHNSNQHIHHNIVDSTTTNMATGSLDHDLSN